MRVINVLPLSRGIFRESLSYFTADDSVVVGGVVSVPVRNREVPALVSAIHDPAETKAELKSSGFALRKIGKLRCKPILLPEFIDAAADTARYFVGSSGAVLSNFLPKAILESPTGLPSPNKKHQNSHSGKKVREIVVIQAGDDERFSVYKSLIRERFARGLSVYLCFPTTREAEDMMTSLDRGIKEYSFIFHGGLTKKNIIATWKSALLEKHPVLIVGTGTFLSIPREDLGTIIIEREGSRFYKSNTRPYADVRIFAEFLAKRRGLELVLGDIALRVETLQKAESGEYAELGSSLKFRSLWGGSYKIVDMRPPEVSKNIPAVKYAGARSGRTTSDVKLEAGRKFEVLSDEVKDVIRGLSSNNERLFIYTSRRGLSPLTLCGDCGTVVNCTRCQAPITLHRGGSDTFFLCHHCGEKRGTKEHCRICGSWKLETLGVGIELVEKAIQKEFPRTAIFRIDKDVVNTHKKALSIADKFYEMPGSVLVGTELSIYYLKEKVENSAVISIDSLFSLPDFRVGERIFSTLLAIRSKTEKRFIIQTRNVEASVLGYAATGTISDFYKEEVEIRRLFNYPPFSVMVKVSMEGRRDAVERESALLAEFFEGYVVETFPAFISVIKGKYRMNALMKVPRHEWPDEKLVQKLKELPLSSKVEIDPQSIL